jgi:hypothetical protein
VLERLEQALNSHDLEQLVACFDEGVLSEQPVHPLRTFRGREQVERNRTQIFAAFPDREATLVRSTIDGDAVWAEWEPVEQDGAGIDAAVRENASAT